MSKKNKIFFMIILLFYDDAYSKINNKNSIDDCFNYFLKLSISQKSTDIRFSRLRL